ncbi:pilus assembly protein MshL [Helicobacter muridarum]|uniref:Pilus assembly protein MshL n=1 Tax=Helicobacter muridarum TaxID=216 RepID=A0A377PX96_9HELI|nr:hypothetical protein [Helicobacter muridarum]TLD98913.1 pilus assembly protein MshL [Helicobacter muridarum]STQ87119.1 Pullulanase secretion envelope pulD [Helicobacter muridarum]
MLAPLILLLFCIGFCFIGVYGSNVQVPDSKLNFQSSMSIDSSQLQHYSIIDDLRKAFNVYSTMNTDLDSYSAYANSLIPFSSSYLDTRFFINIFDENQKKLDIANIQPQDKKNIIKSYLDNLKASKIANTPSLKVIPRDIEPYMDIAMLSPTCRARKFDLAKVETLDSKVILEQLAKECKFSIQYSQDLKKINNTSVIYAKQQSLDFILKMLLRDVFYEIQPHRLIVKGIDMRIFELNYVSSMRMAQSNTDVLFSQEQGGYYSGGYSSYPNSYFGGYGGYSLGGYLPSQNLTQNPLFNYSAIEGNIIKQQLRSQMNNNVTQFGKSGTKVYSLDESNFWTDIESRLNVLLDVKLGDKFTIDKAAGLVSVWTSRAKMEEVSLLLANIESKMNLQVSLDVEILSLTHFSSSNVGIDWQELFRILNPTQSGFSLFGGGGTIFTLQNSTTNLNHLLNFLKTYGSLRSLSNPKIIALNNQPAIISVGSVLRYSQDLVYQSNNANNTIQNTSTQYPSVFAGILLDITPSISGDYVILRINPSITKTKDPNLENVAQALSSPPNLSTNQLSSIVRLRTGQRVVIGGLLSNVNQSTTKSIPKLGEVKGLKNVFGKESRLQRNEELIIIITPQIVD